MTVVTGDCGALLFRANKNPDFSAYTEFYFFKVCTDGHYELMKYDFCPAGLPCAGTTANGLDLVGPSYSDAIRRGTGQENLVAVEANGTTLTVFVNHQEVASTQDSRFSGGQIGVAAEDDTNPTTVTFRDARVWQF